MRYARASLGMTLDDATGASLGMTLDHAASASRGMTLDDARRDTRSATLPRLDRQLRPPAPLIPRPVVEMHVAAEQPTGEVHHRRLLPDMAVANHALPRCRACRVENRLELLARLEG